MSRMITRLDNRMGIVLIIFLFWGLFWGLNGGDKFFNGQLVANTESWSAKGVLVDAEGDIAYTVHPMETPGLYGVNRDAKMVNFFKNIYLPHELALASLYGIAVLELLLGAVFLVLFVWSMLPVDRRPQLSLLISGTVQSLAFKATFLIFVLFVIGDNLFGERNELWEHGTFIILCLVTYDFWRRSVPQFDDSEQTGSSPSMEGPGYLNGHGEAFHQDHDRTASQLTHPGRIGFLAWTAGGFMAVFETINYNRGLPGMNKRTVGLL